MVRVDDGMGPENQSRPKTVLSKKERQRMEKQKVSVRVSSSHMHFALGICIYISPVKMELYWKYIVEYYSYCSNQTDIHRYD